jgi:arginine repressor
MKGKHERQTLIKKILKENNVSSQEELSNHLAAHGLVVAQATLSRDIRELHITKVHDESGYHYHSVSGDYSRSIASDPSVSGSIVSVEISGQIAVVKTRPGHAGMIASVIDGSSMDQIMGSIAGDDTIMMALRKKCSEDDFFESLCDLFKDVESKRIL